MVALSVIFRLGSLCSLWAFLCFAVYAGLRLFGRRFRLAANCFGALCLVLWLGIFGVFTWFAGEAWGEDPVPPYPWLWVSSVGAVLVATLCMGGLLLREATQKQLIWWHGVLFCSVYLVAADAVAGSVLSSTSVGSGISRAWSDMVKMAGFSVWGEGFSAVSAFMIWIFPMGAPIAEIGFHSFRRVFVANREGWSFEESI